MMDEQNLREYYLKDILAAKHYPQVLRVTRPYLVENREYLKKGQYITVLERRRIELLKGTDKEKRPFKVRNDRSAIVEVVEQHRIAHSLAEVAGVSSHIMGIEVCKELRFDKITFHVGERLTIEKIGKSFRGRMKNINLRRERDNKVYRLPLDVIGSFKLIAGKTKLPITKLMNLRTLPITAQFRNTPTSSNFPSGIVNVQDMMLCDIVYILTVQEETYTYEAFSIESNIYVEKCNLKLPRPVLKLVPDGIYVNSSDFIAHKQKYKEKLFDIDSKLIENIYAPGYYGSATYDKNKLLDEHLVDNSTRKRISSTLSLDETYDHAMRTLSEYSSNASTPDSEISNTLTSLTSKKPPDVLPRHSKNRQREKRQTMTAIHEFDWSQQGLGPKSVSDSNIVDSRSREDGNHHRHSSNTSGDYTDAETSSLDLPLDVGAGSNRSNCSTRSRLSDRYEGHPSKIFTPLEDHEVYYQTNQNKDRLVGRIYEVPNGPVSKIHSRSSSIVTEDSGDSGVVLNFHPSTPFYQGKGQHTEDENVYTYTIPPKTEVNSSTNVRSAPPQYIEQNVHTVHVDIDISNDSNNNSIRSSNNSLFTQGGEQSTPPTLQPRVPTQEMPEHRSNDYVNSVFVNEAVGNKEDEIRGLTQDQTGVLLKWLNLARYVPIFNSELINGDLLLHLEEITLISDLGMTNFDARKLFRYVHGWRPVICYGDDSDVPLDPNRWSVNMVVGEMLKIKLPLLARFCKDNHVDGPLLVEIVQGKLVETMKNEHDITLSGIELSRLKAFILKKWRPDAVQPPENTRRISQHERSFSTSTHNISTSSQPPQQQHVMTSHSNSSLSLNNMAPQERERLSSAEKKKSNSLWNRIKAV